MIVARAVVTTPNNDPIRQIRFMTRTSGRIERFLACSVTRVTDLFLLYRPRPGLSRTGRGGKRNGDGGQLTEIVYGSQTVPSTVSNTARADAPNDCVIWEATCSTGTNPGDDLQNRHFHTADRHMYTALAPGQGGVSGCESKKDRLA